MKAANAPSPVCQETDGTQGKGEARPLVGIGTLCSFQYVDTGGWVPRRISGHKNLCHLSSVILFRNKWQKKAGELDNSGRFTWKDGG